MRSFRVARITGRPVPTAALHPGVGHSGEQDIGDASRLMLP